MILVIKLKLIHKIEDSEPGYWEFQIVGLIDNQV